MSEVNQDMLNALRNGEQMDFDGIMVKVSRQACEEGADLIEAQATLITELVGALRDCHKDLHKFAPWSDAKTRAWEILTKAKDQTNDR